MMIADDNDQANVVIEGTGIEGVLTRRELTNDRDANVADLVKVGETLEGTSGKIHPNPWI